MTTKKITMSKPNFKNKTFLTISSIIRLFHKLKPKNIQKATTIDMIMSNKSRSDKQPISINNHIIKITMMRKK